MEDVNAVNVNSMEATLSRLLDLEREKRIAAEILVEGERQAVLQLKVLLDNLHHEERRQQTQEDADEDKNLTVMKSVLSSSSIGRLPRAFSQEFYDTVLSELSSDVQTALGIPNELASPTLFSQTMCAIKLNDSNKLQKILAEDKSKINPIIVEYGRQLLHEAVERGNADCVQVLLKAGCNPNEPGIRGVPPLIIAAKNGHRRCLKVLLEFEADLNISDSDECTALYVALQNGRLECIDVLLRAGPDMSCVTKYGNTVLHAAVQSDLPDVLRSILVWLQYSLESSQISNIVNCQNIDGHTALHQAAAEGYKGCVEILCACHEVNINLLDTQGRSASNIATKDCQLILSTKGFKLVRVVIETGETSYPRVIVGTIRVLSHHTWNDICLLVKGALDNFISTVHGLGVASVGTRPCHSQTLPPYHGKVKDNLLSLPLNNTELLSEEITDIIQTRQDGLKPLQLDIAMIEDYCIGRHSMNEAKNTITPYEALNYSEDMGDLLEVNVSLKRGMERIGFVSLYPLSVLKEYVEVLIRDKAVIIHGPPEFDLSFLVTHLSSCLKNTCSTSMEKVHVSLYPSFSRTDLISLLYDNDLIEPCFGDTSIESLSINGSSLLIMEGIDKLQNYDALLELRTLLERYQTGEEAWLNVGDSAHQSSIPSGRYKLSRQCYIIATRTLFTSTSQKLPQYVMDNYAHIWLTDSEEPAVGFLLRYLLCELINTRKGKLPTKSNFVYQAVVWVWQIWLLYNHYMRQLDFHQLTIGPKMFLNCPVQSNNADSIYNWFVELWNFHLVPKIRENILNSESISKKTSKNNTFKILMFFLTNRLIQYTCPLPSEDIHDFVQALHGNSDTLLSRTESSSTGKNSPKPKKGSLKSSETKKQDFQTSPGLSPPTQENSPKHSTPNEKSKNVKKTRPKSGGGLFSKSATLRRSLFKGSRMSLYAVEEEDASKAKRKEKQDNMENLFDMLMTTTDSRLNEQRMTLSTTPPHHVISVSSSEGTPETTPTKLNLSLHSLSDQLDPVRPLSADNLSRSSPHDTIPRKKHPRISHLVESHTLPRQRSRSEDNVFLSSLADYDEYRHPSSDASLNHHRTQVSNSSDALSDSIRSSTDSNSLASIGLLRDSSHNNLLTDETSCSIEETSLRDRRKYQSMSMLYSASLGFCMSTPRRRVSVPAMSTSSSTNQSSRMSTSLFQWEEEDSVEM